MSLKSSEKTGTNEVTIELTIDAKTFADAVNKAFNKNKNKITVPGFRKGKVPKAFIEKYYGENVFYDDALEIAFPDVYEADIKEAGIDAVDSPFDFDVKSIGKDGVDLVCKVTVKPEIEMGEYKALEAEKDEVTVTAEDIEKELSKKQEENARFVDVDSRAVEDGDIVTIDFNGLKDGVAFEGGKAEDYELTIGAHQFVPGFEEQIIGHSIGEEFNINIKFPEDYGAEDLAGQDVVFEIKLKAIKVKELDKVDDDFAKDVSEFETLDELKSDIEKNLTETRQNEADDAFKNLLLDMITDGVVGEIPECMIEKAIEDMINDFDYRLRSQGMDFDSYMKYTGMSIDDFKKSYRDRAEKDVKLMLALEKIIKDEKIEATDEDLADEYKKIADMYKISEDDVKKAVSEATLREDIQKRKAIDIIVSSAKALKKTEKKAEKEAAKAEESADDKAEAPKPAKRKKPAAKKTEAKAEDAEKADDEAKPESDE